MWVATTRAAATLAAIHPATVAAAKPTQAASKSIASMAFYTNPTGDDEVWRIGADGTDKPIDPTNSLISRGLQPTW